MEKKRKSCKQNYRRTSKPNTPPPVYVDDVYYIVDVGIILSNEIVAMFRSCFTLAEIASKQGSEESHVAGA